MYDLIVVGGGPGGSIAAKTAADAGMNVLMLERSRFPGEKNASGFGLTSKAFRDFPFLKSMDLPSMRKGRMCTAHLLEAPPGLEERFSISSAASNRMGYEEGREFITIMMLRREFDQYLWDKALESGAEARLEALVTDVVWDRNDVAGVVLDGGEEFRAPVVIGADGVMSMVARKAGIRKKWSPEDVVSVCAIDYSASRERIDQVSYDSTFHAFFAPGIGGNYFFFMGEGVHVGGPGVTHSLISRAVKMRNNPARELLETVLDNPPTQRLLRAVDAVPREWQVHCLPWLDHMPTGTYTGGLMLVGDAAGLPEPMWAEGVWQAMYSGRLATEVAKEVIDEGDMSRTSMERYHERLTASPVGQEFVGAAQLRKLFEFLGDPVLFENFADLLVDFTVNLLMSGQEPKGEMFRRIFPILKDSRPTISTLTRLYMPVIARSELNAAVEKLKELKSQVAGGRQEG